MKKAGFFAALSAGLLFSAEGFSQLVNDGATIMVQPGAVVFVAGNFENKNSGAITNNGKIEVQGNVLNTASYTTGTADDSLILSGGGNVTLNGGSSTFTNLWINKTAATNRVTLTNTFLLSGKLDYDQGLLTTDPIANPAYLFSAPVAATFDFAAGKEIIGNVRRTGWANSSSILFNQANMQVSTAAGTSPTDITVTMIPLAESGDPTDNEREVKRKFQFAQTGGTGFTADVRMPYTGTELNTNTEANLVPWGRFTGVWNGRLTPVTRDAVNDWVSTTGIAQADFVNEWKLADPRYTFTGTVYLRGAWNNGTGLMRTNLNTGGNLPLSQPYCLACPAPVPPGVGYPGTETVGAIPNANIVDWVLVEFRKPANGLPTSADASTIKGRKAVFLLNNGTLVDLDGVSPVGFDINQQGAGFMVVKHRNHLAIMSNSIPSNAAGTFDNNFSVLANVYSNQPTATSPPATVLFASLPGSGLYGMWPGDVNRNGSVATSDVTPINSAIAGPPSGNTNVYNVRDVNHDRNVTTADVSNTNFSIGQFAQSSTFRNGQTVILNPVPYEKRAIKSHVPGEATND
jgi:hypothetical protein